MVPLATLVPKVRPVQMASLRLRPANKDQPDPKVLLAKMASPGKMADLAKMATPAPRAQPETTARMATTPRTVWMANLEMLGSQARSAPATTALLLVLLLDIR
jgi:hypothetical protein